MFKLKWHFRSYQCSTVLVLPAIIYFFTLQKADGHFDQSYCCIIFTQTHSQFRIHSLSRKELPFKEIGPYTLTGAQYVHNFANSYQCTEKQTSFSVYKQGFCWSNKISAYTKFCYCFCIYKILLLMVVFL